MSLHKKIESTIHSEIPLCKQMGISIEKFDDEGLIAKAPLAPNINHKNSAFGGSLYNVCVIAGWSMVYGILLQKDISAHVVIQHSNIDYRTAVTSEDIVAFCESPKDRVIEKFIKTFEKRGMSRIALVVKIMQNDELAVHFEGKYVIHT